MQCFVSPHWNSLTTHSADIPVGILLWGALHFGSFDKPATERKSVWCFRITPIQLEPSALLKLFMT